MAISSIPTKSNPTQKKSYERNRKGREDSLPLHQIPVNQEKTVSKNSLQKKNETEESENSMRRRARVAGANGGSGGAPAELLFCFPSSSHLAFTPKPICSPSRPAHLTKRHPTCRGHSSPLFRSKAGSHSCGGSGGTTSSATADDITDEPTSPKVTCAGQIKIRPRSSSGRNPATSSGRKSKGWLSVMEEMERLHRNSKKPLMHFLGALRCSLRFDLRCFGSFHGAVDCSTDEGDGREEDREEDQGVGEDKDLEEEGRASRTIISKWFMVLEQNQRHELNEEDMEKEVNFENPKEEEEKEGEEDNEEEAVPPHNALLLMRCRSAPAKGERRIVIEKEEEMIEVEKVMKKKKERLLLMSYAPDFTKLSTEIAKETWVAGKFDPLARSQSWKR